MEASSRAGGAVREFRYHTSRKAFELVQDLLRKEKQLETYGADSRVAIQKEIESIGQSLEAIWNSMDVLARLELIHAVVAELVLKKEEKPS
jgi:hypothetical protein